MVKSVKKTSSMHRLPTGILGGILITLISILAGAFIITWMVNKEKMELESVGVGSGGALFIALFLGNLTSTIYVGEKKALTSLLYSVSVFATFIIINMLFFGGLTAKLWIALALIAAASVFSLGMGLIKRDKNKYRKIRSR